MNSEDQSTEGLGDERRLFVLRQRRNELALRMQEIDTWLFEVGRRAKTRQDQKVKGQFISEKMQLERQLTLLKEQMRQINQRLQDKFVKMKAAAYEDEGSDKVTDHALVRWLERRHGINVAEMKAALHREAMEALSKGVARPKLGTNSVRATLGEMVFVFVPASKNIVTCYRLDEDDDLNY